MKHKTTKFLRPFLALAFALCLGLGTALSALAAPVVGGTEGSHAKITLTKTLRLSSNLGIPTASFSYSLTPVDIDGDTTQTGAMPAITIADVAFSTGMTPNSTALNVNSYNKASAQFPADTVVFPKAGVYTYHLAETSGTYTAATGETMTYDPVTYLIKLYVKNGTSACYVYGIEAWTVDTNGHAVGKVDVTPTDSELVFVSNFSKVTDASNALFLSKEVSSAYADQTKYFSFNVKVTAPASAPTATYKAYVLDASNAVVTAAANYSGSIDNDGSISITSDTDYTIKLKHGQRLQFGELPIGAYYEMTEAATPNYKATVKLYQGSTTPTSFTGSNFNVAVSTNEANNGNAAMVALNAQNGADFINAYNDANITPTGIIINNLPYFLLLTVAVGALVLFVTVKARKRQGYSSR